MWNVPLLDTAIFQAIFSNELYDIAYNYSQSSQILESKYSNFELTNKVET